MASTEITFDALTRGCVGLRGDLNAFEIREIFLASAGSRTTILQLFSPQFSHRPDHIVLTAGINERQNIA
jgi:hypothetical protein